MVYVARPSMKREGTQYDGRVSIGRVVAVAAAAAVVASVSSTVVVVPISVQRGEASGCALELATTNNSSSIGSRATTERTRLRSAVSPPMVRCSIAACVSVGASDGETVSADSLENGDNEQPLVQATRSLT